MTYCGYDPALIEKVVHALRRSALEAEELSAALGRDLDEAGEILAANGGAATSGTRARSTPGDPYRLGLTLLVSSTPDLADETQCRLDHLMSCEELQREGLAVDRDAVFDAAAVPTPEQVRTGVQRFRDVLSTDHNWDGNQDDLQQINDMIKDMGAAEREAFIGALTDQDLDAWNREATRGGRWFSGNGFTRAQILWLNDTLLPDLDRTQVERLTARLRVLESYPPSGRVRASRPRPG